MVLFRIFMKKFLILIFLFILMIISVDIVDAVDVKEDVKLFNNVKQLINYAKQNNMYKADKTYKSFNENEFKQFVEYLEKNPGELPPIYFVIVADQVYDYDKDKAVFMYNFGKVRALEDVKMCKDQSARQQTFFYGLMAPKTLSYMQSKATDIEYVSSVYSKIIEWDNIYSNRVSPIWACYHGIQAFDKEPELLPDNEFEKIKSETHESLKNIAKIIKNAAEKTSN